MVGVGYKAAARAVVVVVIVVVVSELAKTSFLMSQRIEAAPIKCAGGESARLPEHSHIGHTKVLLAVYEKVRVTGRFSTGTFFRSGF